MGTAELSVRRIRNHKRRQGRRGRINPRTDIGHGGAMVSTRVTRDMTEKDIMRVWVDEYDVGSPNGGYTDAKWRAECEQRSLNLKSKVEAGMKANQRQVGGDHYKNMGVEPWDVVDTWPIDQRIGAYRHGALKYLMRMGSKDEHAQEIGKGIHYLEKLLEVLKERDNG